MKIIIKNARLNNTRQLGILLLFLILATGCGNKGDLYHPDEVSNNQANQNTMLNNNVSKRLPL